MPASAARPQSKNKATSSFSATNFISSNNNMKFEPLPVPSNMHSKLQPQTSDMWAGSRNAELDMILNSTNANPTAPNYLDFNMQMLAEEPFLMGDFLQDTPTFDSYHPGKQSAFDASLWANPPPHTFSTTSDSNANNHNHTNLDYFALENEEEQVVAPADLLTHPASVKSETTSTSPPPPPTTTQSSQQPQPPTDPNIKIPKKRGRKRKQLDASAQVVERKKFLERNRVAANRCRERKKTYVSNLETRGKEMQSKNSWLRDEMARLSEEVLALRVLVGVECGCDDEVLAKNLRERLLSGDVGGEWGVNGEVIEEVVQRFLRMRNSGGIPQVATWEGMGAERLESLSSSSSSVGDEVFTPPEHGKSEEDVGDSSESSPIDGEGEREKLNYMAL